MSLKAYQKAAALVESPRETERRLFAQITRSLIDASADRSDLRRLTEALDRNRRFWTALATDCAGPGNQLPAAVRAQIISISLWVSRHSSAVLRDGADMESLIDVNRTIMAGLGGDPGMLAASPSEPLPVAPAVAPGGPAIANAGIQNPGFQNPGFPNAGFPNAGAPATAVPASGYGPRPGGYARS